MVSESIAQLFLCHIEVINFLHEQLFDGKRCDLDVIHDVDVLIYCFFYFF